MLTSPLTQKDCPEAARLHKLAFFKGWGVEVFQEFLQNPLVQGLKIEEGDVMCGYILWREIGDESEILTLVIAPEKQNKGQGRHLLNTLFHHLRIRGISKLFIEVAEDNVPAKHFYLKEGFVLIGMRPHYYPREGNKSVSALNFLKKIV